MKTTNNYFNNITEIYDHILTNGKSVSLARLKFDSDSKLNDINVRETINQHCENLAKEMNTDTEFSINGLKDYCEDIYIECLKAVGVFVKFLPRLEFKKGLLSIGGRFNRKTANFRMTTITATKLVTMFFRIYIANDTRIKAENLAIEIEKQQSKAKAKAKANGSKNGKKTAQTATDKLIAKRQQAIANGDLII